jgi:hypothetical protein
MKTDFNFSAKGHPEIFRQDYKDLQDEQDY